MEDFLDDEFTDDDFTYDPDGELVVTMIGATEHGDLISLKAVKEAEPVAFSNCLKNHGGRLICEAVRWRQYEAADFLLCNGCSTRKQYPMKTTAIHLAARDHHATEFLERLIMYTDTAIRDDRSNTPLHSACFAGVSKHVEILLQHGAQCDDMNSSLQTPLHLAAFFGHTDCVKLLLQSGALVNARDSEELMNRTPLDSAVQSLFAILGHRNLINGLRAFANWIPCRGDSIFEHLKSLNIFNNQPNSNSNIPVSQHNESLTSRVKALLQTIDVLIQNGARFDVLILAAKHLPREVFTEVKRELIENCKVDVNARDHLNFTPLHFVVLRFSYDDTLEYFIKHGADVNAKSITNVTPLEIALKENAADRAVKLLIENGACVNYAKDSGWSPLTFALVNQKYSIAESLLKHGANPNVREPGVSGFTPLMRLVNRPPYNTEAIYCLLKHGADVTVQDTGTSGFTALHLAAMCPSRGDNEGREVVSMMLKRVKNVDVRDNSNFTPLLRAVSVSYASIPIIRLLLDSGADPHFCSDDEGDSPLEIAINNSKSDVINILMEYETSFDPAVLFSKRNTLLTTIAINKPYDRNELFAIRKFHHREDINVERMKTVKDFARSKNQRWDQDFFNNLVYCLYEFLHGSPLEHSCLSLWTHGYTVLFCEAEHYVLKTKRIDKVDESMLRGVLEYRLEVHEGDSYKNACCREFERMQAVEICDGLSVKDLLTYEMYELTKLMRRTSIFRAISHNLDAYSDELEFPIYGETIKRHVRDSVARRNLLHAASYFINDFFAKRHTHDSKNRTLCYGNPHDSFSSLPQDVLDNILSYLSNTDLINWILSASKTSPQFIDELRKLWKVKLKKMLTSDSWKMTLTPAKMR